MTMTTSLEQRIRSHKWDREAVGRNIAAIARTWPGTPFFPHMAKKGVGADCVQLARAIYVEAGIVPETLQFPRYRLDGGSHRESSAVIEFLEQCPHVENCASGPEVPMIAACAPGNLVTFEVGRVAHHVGVTLGGGKFVHAIRRYGVIECELKDPTWLKRLRSVWRPKL